jgi:hypothetical protein
MIGTARHDRQQRLDPRPQLIRHDPRWLLALHRAAISLKAITPVPRLFFRPGPDFSERDRALLTLLRPHLHQAYLDAESRRAGTPQLTGRQWELLRLVAAGHTNAQMAGGWAYRRQPCASTWRTSTAGSRSQAAPPPSPAPSQSGRPYDRHAHPVPVPHHMGCQNLAIVELPEAILASSSAPSNKPCAPNYTAMARQPECSVQHGPHAKG